MFSVIILKNIPALTKDEYDCLFPFISLEKQERIKQFHFEGDAHNCLLGDILIRSEICRLTGMSNKQLEFSVNMYGKPFLIDNSQIHFNISHAGCYVACVLSSEPVGIDIEIIKPIELKIAEQFFTSDEMAYVMDENHICRFYEVWTKKESRIKKEGKGLSKSLTSFSVFELIIQEPPLIYHKVFRNEEAICHVCSTKQALPLISVINTSMFIQSISPTLFPSHASNPSYSANVHFEHKNL